MVEAFRMTSTRVLALLLTISILLPARTLKAQAEADRVRKSIDEGVNYLLREQGPRGTWPEYSAYAGGVTALCTLALLNAGVPADDERIERALGALR